MGRYALDHFVPVFLVGTLADRHAPADPFGRIGSYRFMTDHIDRMIYSFFFLLHCFKILSFFLSNYYLSFGTLSLIIHLLLYYDASVYAPM